MGLLELPKEDELGHLANRQCRKRPVPSSSACQPVACPIARKKPRLEPETAGSVLGAPMAPKTNAGVQELLSAPAVMATTSFSEVVRAQVHEACCPGFESGTTPDVTGNDVFRACPVDDGITGGQTGGMKSTDETTGALVHCDEDESACLKTNLLL